MVPGAANMYVQPVTSSFIRRWNTPQQIEVSPGDHITFPVEFMACAGAPSLHDLQLDQVDENLFSPLSPPVKVFRFESNLFITSFEKCLKMLVHLRELSTRPNCMAARFLEISLHSLHFLLKVKFLKLY